MSDQTAPHQFPVRDRGSAIPRAIDWLRSRWMALREGWWLYYRLVGARGRSQMQYKLSFALSAFATMTVTVIDFGMVLVLFGRIPHLAGWSLAEVALLYGMANTPFAIAEMFGRGFDLFSRQIVQGTFDRVLTRPLGAFFQVLASDLAVGRIGRVGQGVAILAIALREVGVSWSADRVLVLALALVSGIAIVFSIFLFGAASCFWTVQTTEAVAIFANGGVLMASYPLEVFHTWVRRFATFVVPMAFVNYYPALYLLGRHDPLGLPPWVGLLSPVAAIVFVALAWVAWSAGVRHYQSTGS